jgi:hypothetical protein
VVCLVSSQESTPSSHSPTLVGERAVGLFPARPSHSSVFTLLDQSFNCVYYSFILDFFPCDSYRPPHTIWWSLCPKDYFICHLLYFLHQFSWETALLTQIPFSLRCQHLQPRPCTHSPHLFFFLVTYRTFPLCCHWHLKWNRPKAELVWPSCAHSQQHLLASWAWKLFIMVFASFDDCLHSVLLIFV